MTKEQLELGKELDAAIAKLKSHQERINSPTVGFVLQYRNFDIGVPASFSESHDYFMHGALSQYRALVSERLAELEKRFADL